MRLISVREIRTEQASDYIAAPCRGMGRTGRRGSIPREPRVVCCFAAC